MGKGATYESGIRSLCDKYAALIRREDPSPLTSSHDGPSVSRDNPGDLVLAQILGTRTEHHGPYTKHTQQQLGESAERLSY